MPTPRYLVVPVEQTKIGGNRHSVPALVAFVLDDSFARAWRESSPASSLPVGTADPPVPATGRDDGGLAATPTQAHDCVPTGREVPTQDTAGEPNTPRPRYGEPQLPSQAG